MDIQINNIEELQNLKSTVKPRILPSGGKVRLNIAGFTEKHRTRWENKINTYYAACGCEEGSVSIFVGVLLYVVYLLLRNANSHITWVDLVSVFVLVIVSGAFGKVYGLYQGKVQLNKTIDSLVKTIQ